MIKLIASDIDGTLLSSDKKLLDSTREAIKWAKEIGICFVLSTGRSVVAIKELINELGLTGPMITYNGALVVDAQSDKVIYKAGLSAEAARKIIDFGLSIDTTMCIWSNNIFYSNKNNERTDMYQNFSTMPPTVLTDFEPIINQGIEKVLYFDVTENIPKLREQVHALKLDGVRTVRSQPMFLENINENASKSNALSKIAEYLGICREEIMALGDGENDKDMLEYAGIGVAMKNGDPLAKAAADYITGSNDDGGFAAAIYKFCK